MREMVLVLSDGPRGGVFSTLQKSPYYSITSDRRDNRHIRGQAAHHIWPVRTWYLAIRDIPDGKADTIVEKLKAVGEATIRMLRVTDTGTSQSMETEGFRRGLDFLLNEGVDVDCVEPDRHRGVPLSLKTSDLMAICQKLQIRSLESVQEGTGQLQEEGDEDAGLATPFTTALKHLKGAPEEIKLNQNSDMYMDFLSQVPERNATVGNYATHIALASMVPAAFVLVIKVDRKYEKGDINGQGNQREIKQGLFQHLRGRPSEEQEQWLQSLSDGMSI
ncbi:hypothetical protein Bbelb_050350 [Branchiostoma belcheri]|nr:hypothetical protein Bbelb_050350 [Branchiostoma belcheri]